MQTHDLKRKTKNAKLVKVGRGGKRGKTSGRGHKGQKARSGHRIRPEIRDTIKRLPKLRGRGKNLNTSIQTSPTVVNIAKLDALFEDGATITPALLLAKKAISRFGGMVSSVKILSMGETTKKFNFENCTFSAPARAKIEKAGGSIK